MANENIWNKTMESVLVHGKQNDTDTPLRLNLNGKLIATIEEYG